MQLKRRTAMTWGVAIAATTIFTASPALAFSGNGTLSTTGASGAYKYVTGAAGWDLFARDPLSDGHCAQWQIRHPGGSWNWYGNRVCSGTETYVYAGAQDEDEIRICRTGIGNCSAVLSLELS